MSYNVDFGKLTEDETKALAIETLGELRLDARVKAVLEAFDTTEREELKSQLDDDMDDVADVDTKAP